jgi:transcriptional regulator with AAA-type ATPase domain
MSDIAIQVENLSKQYQIGSLNGNRRFGYQRLQSDAVFAQQLTENARRRIRQFHPSDKRVQIMGWIQTGKEPTYQ